MSIYPGLGAVLFVCLFSRTAAADEPLANVHTNAPAGTRFERWDEPTETWTLECVAPCERSVPLSGAYRVADAAGAPIERPFRLHGRTDDRVVVDVKPPSKSKRLEGAGLVVLGAAVVAGSVAAIWGLGRWVAASRGPYFKGFGEALLGGFGQVFAGVAGIGGAVTMGAGVYFIAAPPPDRLFQYTDNHPAMQSLDRKPSFVLPLSVSF